MKSKSISLEDELNTLDKKCRILLTGEWISLVLSGVGTVVTALTQNAVFAATPISCSLFLNILSRSHQDKRIYDQSSQNLIEMQRQYASKIQAVRSEFLGVDFSAENGESIPDSANFEELATKVKQLESFLEIQGGDYYSQGGAVNQEVSILRNHQLEMAEAIEELSNQFEAGVPNNSGANDIQDHLDRLSSAVYELEQKTSYLSELGEYNGTVQESVSGNSDVIYQLEPIQSQLAALEERMNMIATADPAYDPNILEGDMQSILHPLQEKIAGLEEKIHSQSMPLDASAMDQSQLSTINTSIGDLQTQLDHSISQITNEIGEFQGELQRTHEQIDQVNQRINALQEIDHSQVNNPEDLQRQFESLNQPLKERLNGIQDQLGEISLLQAQIDQVRGLAQSASESFTPDAIHAQVNQATAPIKDKLEALENNVQSQSNSQDFTGQLHQVIEPLQSHMVELEQRINQLSSEGDRTPLLNKVAALQGQVETFESRLANTPSPAAAHSNEIQQLAEKVASMQAQLQTVSSQVNQDLEKMPEVIESKVDEKAELLAELQSISFEEEITGTKKKTRSELDNLLDSLNF